MTDTVALIYPSIICQSVDREPLKPAFSKSRMLCISIRKQLPFTADGTCRPCTYFRGLMLIILSWVFFSVNAQTRSIDSLKKVLSVSQYSHSHNQNRALTKAGSDTLRLNALLELGNKISYYNTDTSNLYLRQALVMATDLQRFDKKGEAFAYLGSNFYYQDQFDSALYYFDQSLNAFKQDGSLESLVSMATIRSEIADIWVARGDYQPAIQVYLNVIDTLKRFDPEQFNSIGNLYLAVGTVYRNMQQYQKALSYDSLGVAQLQKDKEKPDAAALGALHMASNLISLNKFAQAQQVLQDVEKVAQSLGADRVLLNTYGNWAGLYDKKGEPAAAIRMYQKAYQLAIKIGDSFSQGNCLMQIGLIYSDSTASVYHLSSALNYLKKALALETEMGNKHKESQLLRALATVNQKLGSPREAARYYALHLRLSDSLSEADTKIKINELETKYQIRQKTDSLMVMRKNAELRQLQLAKKQSVNTGLIIGCTLLLLLAFALYRNYKRKNQLLIQARQLHAQKIQELEKQRQLVAMQSVIQGQEAERSRLARDLHDGVGGLLSGVKLSLSTMKGNVFLSEKNVQAVASVIDQLDASIQELRRVSHNMMPEALIKFGLREALENYAESITQTGQLKVQLQTFGTQSRMPQDTEIVVYRIVQELLGNVIKHAGASEVLIQLMRKEDRFTLTVEDNGKGFDKASMDKAGAGLANVKARAAYLDGTVDIHSTPGQGSSITVEAKSGS